MLGLVPAQAALDTGAEALGHVFQRQPLRHTRTSTRKRIATCIVSQQGDNGGCIGSRFRVCDHAIDVMLQVRELGTVAATTGDHDWHAGDEAVEHHEPDPERIQHHR